MLVKEAVVITGGLSNPSKMPGRSINLDNCKCVTGSKLALIPGSVCNKCYASRGRYLFTNTKDVQSRRVKAIKKTNWVDAMVFLIEKQSPECFRWHDSGDIQSMSHLKKIIEVVNKTPNTKHWLPTKEYAMVAKYLKENGSFPTNLVVRLGMPMIDEDAGIIKFADKEYDFSDMSVNFSAVSKKKELSGTVCNSANQEHKCGSCRKCWDKSEKCIVYLYH